MQNAGGGDLRDDTSPAFCLTVLFRSMPFEGWCLIAASRLSSLAVSPAPCVGIGQALGAEASTKDKTQHSRSSAGHKAEGHTSPAQKGVTASPSLNVTPRKVSGEHPGGSHSRGVVLMLTHQQPLPSLPTRVF